MIEIDEFPGQVTGLPVRALVGGELLSPRLARMHAMGRFWASVGWEASGA